MKEKTCLFCNIFSLRAGAIMTVFKKNQIYFKDIEIINDEDKVSIDYIKTFRINNTYSIFVEFSYFDISFKYYG